MIISRVKDDYSNKDILNTYDELPLWAAPFGLKLLDKVEYKKNIKVLDAGCGLGFPSIEIAQRLGSTSQVYGLDLWETALEQAKYKAAVYDVPNVQFICGDANNMPFEDHMFDIVVSNNGVNNTGDESKTISESYRVLKTEGQFVFTVNLLGTMKEFYDVYKEVLLENRLGQYLDKMDEHIHKYRKPIRRLEEYIASAGFEIENVEESNFNMRFSDGSAMFNYHFIRLCFLKPWIDVVGAELAEKTVFAALEKRLNDIADMQEGLKLTIPFACFTCRKPRFGSI